MPGVGSYLLIGAIAAVVTFVATPIVRRLAERLGWVYEPNARTVHTKPIPDVGGIAMFAGFLVALGVAWAMSDFGSLFDSNSEPFGVLLAAGVVFAVGLFDDIREVSAPAKVFFTVLAGLALVWAGVVMFFFRVPYYGALLIGDDLQPLITVLWLLGMTQAINLIDGLDGLAAGVVAIGAGAFFLYSQELLDRDLIDGGNIGPLFAIIAAGVCIGFLPHNFNPAKIIMGDSGAYLLGYVLAAVSVLGALKVTAALTVVAPIMILGVPVLNITQVTVRRLSRGKNPTLADNDHLHDIIRVKSGSKRFTVLVLWLATLILGTCGMMLSHTPPELIYITVIGTVVLIAGVCWLRLREAAHEQIAG